MNTITPLTSSTSLGSATTRSSGQSSGQRFFHSGEILKATVVETTGKDLFTLDIGGTQIAAQSKASLSPGQVLQLQVATLSPQVELRIVTNSPQQFLGRSLTLVGQNINLTDLLKTLQQTGNTLSKGLTDATVLGAKGNDTFLLDIGGKQISAETQATLSPGQTFQLQLAETAARIQLNFSQGALSETSGQPLAGTGQGIDFSSPLQASPNESVSPGKGLIDATVLSAKGNNIFVLDFGGKQIEVQSNISLSPGQTLQLQMEEVSSRLALKIVPNSEGQQGAGTLVTVSGDPIELAGLLSAFQKTPILPFEDLSSTTRATLEQYFSLQQNTLSGKDGGEVLKHLVDNMGMTMEALLANGDKDKAAQTLKAALLETVHAFKDATEIAKNTHQLLGTIEAYQLAQLHLENPSHFIFPLPFPFLEKGYLMVEDYGQKKESDGESSQFPQRFSLHLALEDLGNLQIDFLQYQDGLFIRFNTDSKDKSNFVESFSSDLKQAITNTALLGLSFSENASDPAADLIKKILPQGSSMLDTTA